MRFFNQDKTIELKENEIDLSKGYLRDDYLIVETPKKMVESFVDEYNQPGIREYISEPVYENVLVFVPFTEEEKIWNRKNSIISRLDDLTKDMAQDQAGEFVPNIKERKIEFIKLHNELRQLEGKQPRILK